MALQHKYKIIFSVVGCLGALFFGVLLYRSMVRPNPNVTNASAVMEQERGIFVYANDDAAFYPFRVIAKLPLFEQELAGLRYVIDGSKTQTEVIRFLQPSALRYEIVSLSEARYVFPDVRVYEGR